MGEHDQADYRYYALLVSVILGPGARCWSGEVVGVYETRVEADDSQFDPILLGASSQARYQMSEKML